MSPHRRRSWLIGVLVAAVAAAVALRAWGRPHPPPAHLSATADYRPGLAADLFLPDPLPRTAPVVVLVPGGGWTSADRAGLAPLADRLASRGLVAVTATYRPAGDGVRFPVPVADVVCAVDAAVARARAAGVTPGPVVLVGHSAGAHLAALAALAGSRWREDCRWPEARVDALVGLAGPYDIARLADVAEPLLGTQPGADPARWRAANPLTWVGQRTGPHPLPVLLVHGMADDVVSPWFSNTFGEALRAAGHPVTVEMVDGATHASIYRPRVVGDRLVAWIEALPRG